MVKIVALVLICAVIIIYLRNLNGELAMLASITAGIIVLYYIFNYVSDTFNVINKLIEMSKIDKEMYLIIFKISAIALLVEFSAGTVNDFGLKNLADKLVFAGKITILAVSLPIIYAIINLLTGLLL